MQHRNPRERVQLRRLADSCQARLERRDELDRRALAVVQALPFLRVRGLPLVFVAGEGELDLEGGEGVRVAEEGGICESSEHQRRARERGLRQRRTLDVDGKDDLRQPLRNLLLDPSVPLRLDIVALLGRQLDRLLREQTASTTELNKRRLEDVRHLVVHAGCSQAD